MKLIMDYMEQDRNHRIDSVSLKTSERYDRLKNVMVILIMSYDPFGWNRMVYTIKNVCVEQPDMKYEDGLELFSFIQEEVKGIHQKS